MNLTEKSVSNLKAGPKRIQHYDDQGGGFGVRIEAKHLGGRANYFFRKKVGGRVYYKSLGEVGIVALREARDQAHTLSAKAIAWKNAGYPADACPFARLTSESKHVTAKCPTFAELRDAYCQQHIRPHSNKPERAELRVLALAKYLKDWNSRPIDSIGVEDVLAVKAAQGKHHHMANRITEFVRSIFNWSARSRDGKINFWKVENPAANVSRYKEVPRERFVRPEELAAFNETLKSETNTDLADFIVISLNTGARKLDVLSMKWEDLLWEMNNWRVAAPKNGVAYEVALLPAVMQVLKRRRAELADNQPFVFPGVGRTGHLMDMKKPWQQFRQKAGVPDLHIHDMRRTTGAFAAMAGVGLPAVAQLLGHKSLQSTAIYARFDTSATRDARELGQAKMVAMMHQAKKRISAGRKSLTAGR